MSQFVREAQEDWSVTARVLDGEYQLLYISPEALLRNRLMEGDAVYHGSMRLEIRFTIRTLRYVPR